MDKQQLIQDIQILEIAQGLVTPSTDYKKLNSAHFSFLSQAYNIFTTNTQEVPGQITDVLSFAHFISYKPDIYTKLVEKLRRDSGVINTETKKETSSIPAEIETMVALYQEHQASLLTGEDVSHPVADAVKRARKTWAEHERVNLILKNAKDAREKDSEKFFTNSIDPKADSREEIERSIYKVASLALSSQINLLKISDSSSSKNYKAINQIVLLVESGAIDINNPSDLNIATQLALKDQYGDLKNNLSNIDDLVTEQLRYAEIDPYSDKSSDLNKKMEEVEAEANQELKKSTKSLENEIINTDKDFDVAFIEAGKKANLIRLKLQEAVPNAKLLFQDTDPLSLKAKELEKLIRTVNPALLNVNPSGAGARLSGTLSVTGGNTRLSATAVDLYSKGLTEEKFQELKRDDRITTFLQKNKTLQKQIEFQLKKISNSPLGKELDVAYKKISATQKLLDPIGYGRTYINQQLGKHAGELIIKNASSAAGKKLGNFILENGLKEGAKKFADEATKKLIVEAAKQAGIQGTKVAAAAGAESAIAAAAATLGVSTAGLSLIIGAVLIIGTEIFRKLKEGLGELRKSFGYTDEDLKNDKRAALGAVALVASSMLVAKKGVKSFSIATQAAAISAVITFWFSLVTIAVFLTFTFLTAPILSTFVQLDSVEKVSYSNLQLPSEITPGCPKNWPITGKWRITQGPGGKVSHYNVPYDQSVDLGTKFGTPVFSTSDGIVSFAAVDKSYINTNVVIVDSKLPDGKAFQVVYAHLSLMKVKKGQIIKVGTPIGASGYSIWAGTQQIHLHYEYKGIKYNQCPAGNLQLAENCSGNQIPGAGKKCISETSGAYLYSN